MRDRTVNERIADWKAAFDAVRPELTPEPYRVILQTLQGLEDGTQLALFVRLADVVMRTDAEAGRIAADLTRYGLARKVED